VLSALIGACVFACSGAAFAGITLCSERISKRQSQEPILRVQVDLQAVDVQVKDAGGNDVLGLSAQDFTVLENGKPQKIAFFDAGNHPVSLVVLVDSSNSVSSDARLGSAQQIAAQFMRTARPGDEISAMDFTDQMGPFQRLTREQLLNPATVKLALAPSEGSALYDAIAAALCHLRESKNVRQAVIVISDGNDQHSRITLEQLVGLVRSSPAQLFMIGLQSSPGFHFEGHTGPFLTLITGHDIDNPTVVFDRLMKESGAESFIPNSQRGLEDALQAVSSMLQSEYTLAYYPPKTSKTIRKIEVKVDRRGSHALARRYVGSDRDATEADQGTAESVHFDRGTCTVSPEFHRYAFESKLMHGSSGMVYREDFSDARSGWPNHDDSHYISGGYELSNAKMPAGNADPLMPSGLPTEASSRTTFRENVIAAYGPWWNDFHASVTVKAVLAAVSREANAESLHKSRPAAGLIFRMTLHGYYALLISGANKKQMSVEVVKRKFQGDSGYFYSETEIVPWTAVEKESGASTEISVENIGNQISISVDGQPVKSARDDTFDQGLIGFVISGPGRATFKSLVVEQR
jgi:Ca-activated chloride channel homolog